MTNDGTPTWNPDAAPKDLAEAINRMAWAMESQSEVAEYMVEVADAMYDLGDRQAAAAELLANEVAWQNTMAERDDLAEYIRSESYTGPSPAVNALRARQSELEARARALYPLPAPGSDEATESPTEAADPF